MKDNEQRIDEWCRARTGQAPLLVTGNSDLALDQLIKQAIERWVSDKLVAVTDVVELGEERTISIKQVRQLMSGIALRPIAQRRIFYIKQAQRLSLAAASAWLKTLEEAPTYTRFVLTTRWPGRLPVTIRSRCTRWQIKPGPGQENALATHRWREGMMARLANLDSLTEEEIAAIAQHIGEELTRRGPTRELKLSMLRLVDYYRIKEKGGNERLAKAVLLAHMMHEEAI